MVLYCPKCGRRSDLDAKACVICGGRLRRRDGASTARGTRLVSKSERRQITALYCDLIDSVRISVRFDTEELLNLLDLY